MCAHYAVQILEDRIVYKKLFVGKIVIKIEDLDIKNSRYYFVKGKGKRDFGHEILFLKKKDGAEYKIRIEDILQDGYNNDFISAIIFKLKLKREDYCKN